MAVTSNVPIERQFGSSDLGPVRATVGQFATSSGLSRSRRDDLVLICHELATNAIRHAGGTGRLRLWNAMGYLYCEVSDAGPGLADPDRAGSAFVEPQATSGRGLWLVRQIADRIEIETSGSGTVVTCAVALTPAASEDQRNGGAQHPDGGTRL